MAWKTREIFVHARVSGSDLSLATNDKVERYCTISGQCRTNGNHRKPYFY